MLFTIKLVTMRVARDHGRAIGSELAGAALSADQPNADGLVEQLASRGYEPRCEGAGIELDNCPFRALAESHRDLVCGMNYELISGILETAGVPDVAAVLEPAPGRCCVRLRTAEVVL
jgi:predicted ArsR family transcriptional regulator